MTFAGLDNLGSSDTTLVVVALVATFFLIALWSSLTRLSPDEIVPSFGLKARGLFLGVRFRARSELVGHLTTLGLNSAVLVSPAPLAPGDTLELDLASLPDFPGDLTGAAAKVPVAVRSVRAAASGPGASPAYVASLRFRSSDDPRVQKALAAFVAQLGASGRLSHA